VRLGVGTFDRKTKVDDGIPSLVKTYPGRGKRGTTYIEGTRKRRRGKRRV